MLLHATLIRIEESDGFAPCGLRSENWRSAGLIREIFKVAFETARLPDFNPHSFRNTLIQFGARICTAPETFKASSQNLDHEQVLTTFTSFGRVLSQGQAELIQGINHTSNASEEIDPALVNRVISALRKIPG